MEGLFLPQVAPPRADRSRIAVPPFPPWRARLQERLAAWSRNPRVHQLLRVLLLCGMPGIGAYAHLVEPVWLKVRRLTLPLRGLPPHLDGLRLLHLSDLHVGSAVPLRFLARVMETVCRLAPDIIVLTGDFVHTDPGGPAELVGLLSQLRAPHGVFAVLGNHDYGVNYPGHVGVRGVEALVMAALEQAGIVLLRNTWVPVAGGRHPLALVGIDDVWSGRAQIDTLETIPPAYPRLVLSHNPDILQFLPQTSFDVLLCGHTHGGQVRIPPFPPPFTATVNRKFWAGLYPHGRGVVFVSRGIGYTWQVRLAARPECVVITLTGR